MKKLISLVLALAMVLGSVAFAPAPVYADESSGTETPSGSSEPAASSEMTTGPAISANFVLMNIPYEKFYQAEGVEGVDAVTSATKKAYNSGLVGGSYHDTEDASYASTDILGVTYPVFVEDKGVLDPEKAVEADALFAAGDYAYAVLDDTPSASKKLTVEGGIYSFAAIGGRPSALDAEVSVSAVTKRGDYEIEVKNAEALSNATIYGVILTAGEEKFALRHLENIWKGVELAVCTGHTETIKNGAVAPVTYDLEGKTITGITYYVKDAEGAYKTYTIACEVEIPVYPAASFTDAKTIKIEGLSAEDAAKVVVNKDSGENKYYYARVMKGDETIETELTIAEDGAIVLSTDAASGDYTVDIIQYNVKKSEETVMVSMTASYTADGSGSHSGGKSSKSDKAEEQPAAEETPAVDPMEGIYPKKNITRGDMVQALYRLSGENASGKGSFTGDDGKSYEEAAAWAEEKGITAGISESEFGGGLEITREQMVTMLYLYAQKFGKDAAIAEKPDFDDMDDVSSWAVTAVKWAYGKDLVCGIGNNKFDPKGPATGEQLAIVLKNFQQMK